MVAGARRVRAEPWKRFVSAFFATRRAFTQSERRAIEGSLPYEAARQVHRLGGYRRVVHRLLVRALAETNDGDDAFQPSVL